MKKTAILFLAGIMIFTLAACAQKSAQDPNAGENAANSSSSDESFKIGEPFTDPWPTTGLGTMLPEPDNGSFEIMELSEAFFATVKPFDKESFNYYRVKCEKKNFIVDEIIDVLTFDAYDPDGYHLYLELAGDELFIRLMAPKQLTTLDWEGDPYTSRLPKPESTVGEIETGLGKVTIYVGNTAPEDMTAYFDKCEGAGYNIETFRDNNTFSAQNERGDILKIEYAGNNMMKVTLVGIDLDGTD